MKNSLPHRYRIAWPLRLIAAVLIPIHLLTCMPVYVFAASSKKSVNDAPPPPPKVTVNRTVPKVTPPPSITKLSASPTDAEIFRARVFEEPLVPLDNDVSAKENQALAEALNAFLKRASPDDVSAVQKFLDAFPQSRWRVSLLVNLGILYRQTGWFSRSLDCFEKVWNLTQGNDADVRIRGLADRAAGELAAFLALLGKTDLLEKLLGELKNREVRGPASEKIATARRTLWVMKNKSHEAFNCGPTALNLVRSWNHFEKAGNLKIHMAKTTTRGMSLHQLRDLSRDLDMKLQMAKRTSGASLPVPAIVHWSVGHYGAIVEEANGRYRIRDLTLGQGEMWVSRAALDAEGSGCYLIPTGAIPEGWRAISDAEGDKVWGSGDTRGLPDGQVGPDADSGCTRPKRETEGGSESGMAQYTVNRAVVSLCAFDTPLSHTPPRGPSVRLQVVYNQRDNAQPSVFNYSNFGPKWTCDWISYVTDDPANGTGAVTVYKRSGGVDSYPGLSMSGGGYVSQPQVQTRTVVVRPSSEVRYERHFTDGSKGIYTQPDGATAYPRKVFLTQWVDPAGNAINYTYDSYFRLVAITDAIGQVTGLKYGSTNSAEPAFYLITHVTDPFGRSASFEYDTAGRLKKITDVIGITSEFTYDGSGDVMRTLTTPYGTTTFVCGQDGIIRWVEATDPQGEKERTEFRHQAPGIAFTEPEETVPNATGFGAFNSYMNYRNTYFWDKEAMRRNPGDYTKAKIYHWLHDSLDTTATVGTLESEKNPLERRVWYNYAGQPAAYINSGENGQPTKIARRLDDGTSQLYQIERNSLDKPTKVIDPLGRTTVYTYADNKIDLLQVAQQVGGVNQILAAFTYNSQHLPLTATDASGQTISFSYNSQGQLLTVTNPKSETTTLAYNGNGYLTSITGPVSGSTTGFTYDGYGRVRTVTDSEGYTITTDYDVLDRVTRVTYPDGTYESIDYHRLDPQFTRDRLGRVTRMFNNANRQVTAIQDALGRVTNLEWCQSCNALEQITDPLGRVTTWFRDLQGRVINKVYADNKVVAYTYENSTSRLKSVKDAKNQITNYEYYLDNNLKRVSYADAVIATPAVSFEYDASYNRVAKMTDGTGETAYAYNLITSTPALGAGRLAGINGPLGNDVIQYSYDELGRVTRRAINSVASSVVYDALGRVTTATNPLGTFTYSYVNATARLSGIAYPNGQTTAFDYLDNQGDQRLKQIWHKNGSSATISKFDYTYDAEGQIKTWTQQADNTTPNVYSFEYDALDQLLSATLKNGQTQAIVKRYLYSYDKAGNRVSEQIDGGVTKSSYNSANQLTSREAGGPLTFKGTLSEDATVTVGGKAASVVSNRFEGTAQVLPGTNVVPVIAKDYSGNERTNQYQVVIPSGGTRVLQYDANGNETSDGVRTFEWDAANRLVAINMGTHRSEFGYDGLGRRVQIIEKENGAEVSNKRFVWEGLDIAEERDSSGATVIKRFCGEGEQIGGVSYYFTDDHLGSVREMTDSAGTIQARYSFDPYGRRTLVSGTDLADFGFAGLYVHVPSGLNLAPYRAYDAELGRWLSRDPIEDGINLYAYSGDDPVNLLDADGLRPRPAPRGGGSGFSGRPPVRRGVPAGRSTREEIEELNERAREAQRRQIEQYGRRLPPTMQAAPGASVPCPTSRYGLRERMIKEGGLPADMLDPTAHHRFPWALRGWFAERGINVNDYGRWAERYHHLRWSREYNQQWLRFSGSNPNATREEIFSQLETMEGSGQFPGNLTFP